MRPSRALAPALLLSLAWPICAPAQPRDAQRVLVTAPVEVVASRLPEGVAPRSRLLAVIERDAIVERQPASVHDLLRGLSGVDVSEQGPAGGLSFVSIRGGDPNFTLFLVDGVKVNDPTNSRGGGFDLHQIDPALIERIEVYAGSLSSVHGSDALGGVVSITTRRHDGDAISARVSAGAGSHGRRDGSASASGALGNDAHWSAGAALHDGGDAVIGDRLRRRQFSTRLQGELTPHSSGAVQLMGSAGEAESFPEDSGGPRLAVIRAPEQRDFQRWLAAADLETRLSSDWSLRSSLSLTSLRERTANPGIAPGVLAGVPAIDGTRRFTRKEASLSLEGTLSESLAVTVGGSYSHEDGSSDDVIDFGGFGVPASFALQRGTFAAFAEAAWTPLAGLELGGGVRRDHPESAASETVGQLSAAYHLEATGTRVHAEWSQGFKLPSFFALGHPLVGNANLRPEHSTQVEVGISQALLDGAVHLDLTWFHARYRDLIDFDPVAFTNVNRGRVRAQGLEGGLELQLADGLSATASATLNDLDVAPGAAPLRRRPRWKGGAGLRWAATPRWTTRLDATWWGEYFDSSIPTGLVRMPGYWRLDASARWQASKRTAVNFSVRNLLGDDYESSIGFPNGGASGFVSVELSL